MEDLFNITRKYNAGVVIQTIKYEDMTISIGDPITLDNKLFKVHGFYIGGKDDLIVDLIPDDLTGYECKCKLCTMISISVQDLGIERF